jgi:excisionase family DNA binding protein
VSTVFDEITEWYTIGEVAELFQVSVGKVRRLIEEHQLFAIRRDGEPKIPKHIIVDGEPLPSVRGTILVLLDSGFSLEQSLEWLYTADDSLPGKPIDFLLKGHKSAVRRLAMSQAL